MDLTFNEEQSIIKDTVRSFISKEYPEDQVSQLSAEKRYPAELDSKLGELGLYGICFPEQYGGADLGLLEAGIVIEELSRYTIDFGISYGLNLLGGLVILKMGTEEQKKEYISKIIQGDMSFSIGYYEPFLLNDTTKVKGHLSGTEGEPKLNDFAIYTELRDPKRNFILLPLQTGEDFGLAILPHEVVGQGEVQDVLGRDLLGLVRLHIENVRLDQDHFLGHGESLLLFMNNLLKFINLMACIGNMQTVIDQTVQYSKEREQFGRPIGTFQALTHLMVDTRVKVDASRLYGYWIAWLLGKDFNLDKCTSVSKEINMANSYVTRAFVDSVTAGMQVMGGYGYTEEVSMERYTRDARMTTYFVEDAFLQKLSVAGQLGVNYQLPDG